MSDAGSSGNVLALSNVSPDDIGTIEGPVAKGSVEENCNLLTKLMVASYQKMDSMDHRLLKIEKHMAADNSPYAKFFECEENKMMMSILPLLCDGRYGVAGWVPVWINGTLYIILSKKVTVALMEVSVNSTDTTMSRMLQMHLKSAAINPSLFSEIVLKAPFKAYKKNKKMSAIRWLNKNLAEYKVMRAEWFRGLIEEVHSRCDVPEELCADALEMSMSKYMYSDIGMSSQFDVGPVVYDSMGDGFQLPRSKLVGMPAMKCAWWTEVYESGCKQYFGMTEVDGVMGVVTNGKYKEPFEDNEGLLVRSVSYDATLKQLMVTRPHLFSDGVKEMNPDLFDEQPDVATKCKKRKNRAS